MNKPSSQVKNHIVIFGDHKIRQTLCKNEPRLVMVSSLTKYSKSFSYLEDIGRRDPGLGKGRGQIAALLFIQTEAGKQKLNCANTKGMLSLVQSKPTPIAKPFKQWLANLGYERIQGIEDLKLALQCARALYEAKRTRSIQIRPGLTDERKKRNVGEQAEYAILSAKIFKSTFEITPSEDKKLKKIQRENLQNHMTDGELIFTMLGKTSTAKSVHEKNSEEFDAKFSVEQASIEIARIVRKGLESKAEKKIVPLGNYLAQQKRKIKKNEK